MTNPGTTAVPTAPAATPSAPAAPAPQPAGPPTAPSWPAGEPLAFHIMAKPIGPICNLDCTYCYYLEKEDLYPGNHKWKMTDEVLEAYIRQYIEAQQVPEATFGWQGGEPTLLGVEFFRRAVELQKKHAPPGMTVINALQTNGTLLDDEWGRFLHDNQFLVGLSVDGPPELHDRWRVDKQGQPTSAQVLRGLEVLRRHKVEFNILCTVHRWNGDHGAEVYRFFKSQGARFIQFIPIVEEVGLGTASERSVRPEQLGRFLNAVFDDWVRHDVGRIFVQAFDVALECWLGMEATLCVHRRTCGKALALEHNGDVYSCDHFVRPEYRIGNLREQSLTHLVRQPRQVQFGLDKQAKLPAYCQRCEVRFACEGGCPKDRFTRTPDGEPGLNYLCAGYQIFFRHIDGPMRQMAALVRSGLPADQVMEMFGGRGGGRRRR